MPQNKKKKKQNKNKHEKNNNDRHTVSCCASPENVKDAESPEKLYAIKHSDIMGRYLVASRNLKAGDLIIEESPLAIGPCADYGPVCLGCYQKVEFNSTQYRCPGCSWPLCNANCPGMRKDYGHTEWECDYHRDKGTAKLVEQCSALELKLIYEAILPLRCILLKTKNPEKWEKLQEMEAHNEIRKNNPSLWSRNQEVIVDRIRVKWNSPDFIEEEIHTVCGFIEVNCFEIGQQGSKARAMYPSAFLLAHDCSPNTTHTDYPETCVMAIRVIRNLKKGEPITLSYAYTFQGTYKRREHLHEGKFFWCQCHRCSDPTELGTYCSAMRCPKCQNGLILPTAPLDQDSIWKCSKCKYTAASQTIAVLLETMFKELDAIDPHDIELQEAYLVKYRNVLTKNHYLCLSAKYTLCQLYGRAENYLIHNLTDEQLRRKEEYCRDVLKVVSILEPGLSRIRGVIMYELHAPVMILATRMLEKQEITNNELRKRLRETVKLLKESEEILLLEPEGSKEYEMAIAAKDALQRLGDI